MADLLFIVNPAAKNGASLKKWRRLHKRIGHIPHEVKFTEHALHAKRLAQEAAEKATGRIVIVAVGGDGTMHEVMNGAAGFPDAVCAFIPVGSGNDFARGYRLPARPGSCMRKILAMLSEEEQRYDAGYYYSRRELGYFINSLGAGFDAAVSKRANSAPIKKYLNKWSLGKLVYPISLVGELFRYTPSTLAITIDGVLHIYERVWFAVVSNQPFYGGGMKISPHANPADGRLNVLVVHGLTRIKLLFMFASVFWGGHTRFKEVAVHDGRRIRINTDRPVPIHADGESAGSTPVQIEVKPLAWSMLRYESESTSANPRWTYSGDIHPDGGENTAKM